MKAYQKIITLLEILKKIYEPAGRFLVTEQEGISLKVGKEPLFTLSPSSFLFLDKVNLNDKLGVKNQKGADFLKEKEYAAFMKETVRFIVRLNHLGVGYFCQDSGKEIAELKSYLKNTHLRLFEEKSGLDTSKWLFVGNKTVFENPLLEIVLEKRKESWQDEWFPHFQIDLDLSLKFEEIRQIAEKYFGREFFRWELKVANKGTVLGMGWLGEIEGLEIRLDLGSSLRKTDYHRKFLLKEI